MKLGMVRTMLMVAASMYLLVGKVMPVSAGDTDFTEEEVILKNEDPVYNGFSYYESEGYIGISGYSGTETDLVIPECIDGKEVHYIGEYAFYNNSELTSVTLPKYLTDIGNHAFEECTGLTSLTVYSENLNDGALSQQTSFLRAGSADGFTITFADGVTRIPGKIFTSVNDDAGHGAWCNVTKIVIADSVTEIGNKAFFACADLREIEGAKGVKTLGELAFKYTGLTAISGMDSLETIGESCFACMPSLKTVELGDSLKTIGSSAFGSDTALETAVLPKNLETINGGAFGNCSSLKELTVYSENLKDGKRATYPFGDAGSPEGFTITFAEGVKRIPYYIFTSSGLPDYNGDKSHCRVTKIVLADSVTEISYYAFSKCYDLKEIEGGNGVRKVEKYSFEYTGFTSFPKLDALESIEESAFSNMENLKTVVLGKSLTRIEYEAFANDTALETIVLPENLKIMSTRVFVGCTAIKEVTVNSIELEDGHLSNNTCFYHAGCEEGITLTFGEGATRVPGGIFTSYKWDGADNYCRLKKIVLSDTVTEIGRYAFSYCYIPSEIRLPAKITDIKKGAFEGCDDLKTVYSKKEKTEIKIEELNDPLLNAEWIKEKSEGKEENITGSITLNGEKYNSLKAAFKAIKDKETDYTVEINSDVKGEVNLTIPKTAKSVTIHGNGNTVEITGTRLTANATLTLEDVTFVAKTKKDKPAKFTVNGKKGLTIGRDVVFSSAKTTVRSGAEIDLAGELAADVVLCKKLILEDTSVLKVMSGEKITIKNSLEGKGGIIELIEGFNKPIILEGTVFLGNDEAIRITGAKQADGTQILKTSAKKLDASMLKKAFDVSGITDNVNDTYLYYLSNGKACIFGEAIEFNGFSYGLWKEAVVSMNQAVKSGEKNLTLTIKGDVNIKGGFALPKKGYDNLTIDGTGTITFTGNIKLTGNTVIGNDITLIRVDKKGNKVPGKVIKKKYTYTGPEEF